MFKKVYLGNKPIAKIYLGNKLIKYNIVTSIPPKFLNNVPNFTTDVNKAIEMYYVANDDVAITKHEFYDGTSWRTLYPTSIENTHYFTLTFDTVGVKQCQIRISDADGNVVTSNIFTLSINPVVASELIYASDLDNKIYAIDKMNFNVMHNVRESGTVAGISKMNDAVYVVNNNSTTVKRYTDKLQIIEESNATYNKSLAFFGKYKETSPTNYIYAVYPTMIIRHTHNASLTDRKITNNFDSNIKYAVYSNEHIYTLRQDNHIVIYDGELTAIKDIAETTSGDFIMVDNEHVYKCPLEYGTFKKYNIATGQEVLSTSANFPLANGVALGDKLFIINKYKSSVYVFDKSFNYVQSIAISPKVGCMTIDEQRNQLYVGTQNGEIWVYSISDLNNPIGKHSISTKAIQYINLG